ncbi:hypothetical protein NR798_25950 [Archangium gephyra]|uniref:hypothetical protein n=1 Tax=Archangium gephyra TaxID=48 RepID=UPI0035D4C8A5
MLSILVMARFGPWTLLRVEDLLSDKSKWEHCERCDEHIRYVHVCQVDGEFKEWRIGSTCGPTLIQVSDEIWDEAAKIAARNLKLLHRALRLKPLEQQPNSWGVTRLGADWVDKIIDSLKAGQTDKYTLQKGQVARHNDLRAIQARLRLAEKFHALHAYKMGTGR